MLKRPSLWLGVAISLAALALAARGLQFSDVAEAFASARYWWLVPATLAMLASLYVRAIRWQVLFYPTTGLRYSNVFGAMNVGYMLNNILPLRVGELGRAYVIAEIEPVSRIQALTTIVVERLTDLLVVVALLIILLPFIDEPDWATGPALLLGAGILGLAILLSALARARGLTLRAVHWLVQRLPERFRDPSQDAAAAVLDGFATLGHPQVLVRAVGWSVLAWACSSLYMFFTLQAFGLSLSYAAPILVMVAIALGMVVPSSAGYIGVHHAIAIEILTGVFGVDRPSAAGFAIISHALLYSIPTILGALFLWNRRELLGQVFARVSGRPESTREST